MLQIYGECKKIQSQCFFLLLSPLFAEHQDLEHKLSRCFVIDLSGERISPRAFHSLLGYLKDFLCELELLRLLLRLCFSAPHVVCGFCRRSSCALFPVFGEGFLCLYFAQEKRLVNFLPGQRSRLSVLSNIPRRLVFS